MGLGCRATEPQQYDLHYGSVVVALLECNPGTGDWEGGHVPDTSRKFENHVTTF